MGDPQQPVAPPVSSDGSEAPNRSDERGLAEAVSEWRRRFNSGEYYGAHEAAEDAWHAYRGPLRDFLKGLVQLSVSLHHHFAGNRHGAEVKWRSSRAYLAGYEPECLGIDVSHLLRQVARFYESEEFGKPGDGTNRPAIP